MRTYHPDTIAAIATAIGGGIGIIRISGKKSVFVLNKIFVPQKKETEYISHKMIYGHIVNNENTIIDEAFACVMFAPKTYTKEDVVEIHCHGGIQPLYQILELCIKNGARLAEAGEFTKRAFLNGRIDLSQAEAIADLIASKTDTQHKAAVSQLKGKLSKKIKNCAESVLDCLAAIEAAIDYPEHELEMETPNSDKIAATIRHISDEIRKILITAENGRILREGIETAIVGKPNVGKSSLLNALLDEDRAIVTDIPGTTRDMLTEYIKLSGVLLKVSDTAGIRKTCDQVEKIGVERSVVLMEKAELVLLLLDGSRALDSDDMIIFEKLNNSKVIVLINKSDLSQKLDLEQLQDYGFPLIEISAKNHLGLERLAEEISKMFFLGKINADNNIVLTNVRHKESLSNTLSSLQEALNTAENGLPVDFISIDLQAAYEFLGEITGDTLADDIIERIFSEFCLGK